MTSTLVAPMDVPPGRPGCPWWCDGVSCQDPADEMCTHLTEVPCSGAFTITTWQAREKSALLVWARGGENEIGAGADFTAAQVRRFAAELLAQADLIDPSPLGEIDLPARDVRVGDFFQVDGEWLYVYGVSVDEPSFTVQVFTTIERGEWPELDGDEEPHQFELTEWTRVRRPGGAR